MDWIAPGLFVAIIAVVGGLVLWSRGKPYRVEHEGRTYWRLKDGTFTDAAKVPVADPSLLAALAAAYERSRNDAGDWKTADVRTPD